MPTLEEFRRRQAQRGPLAPDRRAALQEERRAQNFVALGMADLEASDKWTIYRKHLEVLREQYESALGAHAASILGRAVGDELLTLKLEHARWSGVVEGLTLALTLPAAVQAQAATIEAKIAGQLDSPAAS